MKKILVLMLLVLASVVQPVLAHAFPTTLHNDDCKCGEDEDGECKTC